MNTSLVVTTYNWPEALELCLLSVLRQSVRPDEVIVADDGSGEPTRARLEELQATYPLPLRHVWHPDEGFQLSRIRNRALAVARGDYILQVDGDVMLHKHFIQDHLNFRKPNFVTSGKRERLNRAESAQVLGTADLSFLDWERRCPWMGIWRLPFLWNVFRHFYEQFGKDRYYIQGCNMSYWREDALAVNGYNEDFVGWGPEDSEFAARLMNRGLRKQIFRFGGHVYHLHHETNDLTYQERNLALLRETVKRRLTRCPRGLDEHLKAASRVDPGGEARRPVEGNARPIP